MRLPSEAPTGEGLGHRIGFAAASPHGHAQAGRPLRVGRDAITRPLGRHRLQPEQSGGRSPRAAGSMG